MAKLILWPWRARQGVVVGPTVPRGPARLGTLSQAQLGKWARISCPSPLRGTPAPASRQESSLSCVCLACPGSWGQGAGLCCPARSGFLPPGPPAFRDLLYPHCVLAPSLAEAIGVLVSLLMGLRGAPC